MAWVPTAPRKSRWVRWLLVGGLIFTVLAALCAGGFAWLWLGGKSEVEPIAEAFLAAIEQEAYSEAYASLGPEWKSIDTLESFTNLEGVIRQAMGPLNTKTFYSFTIDRRTGGGIAVLVYTGQYENGRGQVTITLSDKLGQWKVVGHRVDSPLLLKVLTCPHCGAVNKQLAAFCSACGEPME